MNGLAHIALFNFIYELSGPECLHQVKSAAGLDETRQFEEGQFYDEEEWQRLFDETCSALNISRKRLDIMFKKFFSSSPSLDAVRVNGMPKSDQFHVKKICPLPFSQLFLNNKGKINPCGGLRHIELGDIKDNNLEEIWHGKPMQDLRQSHLDGDFRFCKQHMQNFNCHHTHDLLEYADDFEYTINPKTPMRRLDLDLNAWCNLKCIMCENWKGENGSYTNENFWDEAETKIFPYLHEVALKGGEPMLQEDTYRLMDTLGRVNPACRWNITTNGQYKLSKRMMEKMDQVEIESIGISLDSLNHETYAKVRKGGTLEKSLIMIDDLIKYNESRGKERKFLILANMLITQDTYQEIPDFFKYTTQKRIKLNAEILMVPYTLSIWAFNENKRLDIFHSYVDQNEILLNTKFFGIISKVFNSLSAEGKISCLERYEGLSKKISLRLNNIHQTTPFVSSDILDSVPKSVKDCSIKKGMGITD
jgi:MoaA/NifB/PqqE/SkfB family radical SAM enzyme